MEKEKEVESGWGGGTLEEKVFASNYLTLQKCTENNNEHHHS